MTNTEKRKLSKSPIWPALLSGLVAPGVGQIFNRDFKKGFILLAVSMGGLIYFSKILTEQIGMFLHTLPETWDQDPVALKAAVLKVFNLNPSVFFTFYLMMFLTWIYGVVDAYIYAKNPPPPPPPTNSDEDSDPLG